jgi:hypothetical protein
MRIDAITDLLLGRIHLQEGDQTPPSEEEEEEQVDEEGQEPDPYEESLPKQESGNPEDVSSLPLKDEKEVEVLGEGEIPQDTSGIQDGEYGPLKPEGEVDIQFEQGNFSQLRDLPEVIADKTTMVTQTLEPLIEKALIELLGSSSMFKREAGNISFGPDDNGQVTLSGVLTYICTFWIGTEVDPNDIKHDSSYVLGTLQPIADKVKFTECSIDTADGRLKVGFTL